MANPLGSAPSVILGVGLGAAAATAIEPIVEPARQTAWSNNANKVLDPAMMAALVAQGAVTLDVGREQAKREGFNQDKFDRLVYLAQETPSYGEAQDLRRRGKITLDQLRHTFAKAQVEEQYWDALADLVDERLSPQVVALAIVRGLMTNPGILPVGPPTAVGNIPAFPVSEINPVAESAAGGFDEKRLAVLAGIMGRPMGPEEAAAAFFKGILEHADFQRAISEGDVRNEWADAILANAKAIPSISDYVNARIRGWITDAEMYAGTARHGMSETDTHLLYLRTGRPAAPGQMATAVARGIDGPDGVPMNRSQFLKGIAESDIRPEWGPMLYESRFLYPPLFQLTRLVQAGAVDADTAAKWAEYDRYPPEVVSALKAYWEQPSPTASPDAQREKLATSQAIATLKRAFLVDRQDGSQVIAGLEQLGVATASAGRILETWTVEKGWTVKPLTPSQIKKAYSAGDLTIDEAISDLETLHMTDNDARTYLTT